MANPGGRIPRQSSLETLIRDMESRIRKLEQIISSIAVGSTPLSDAPTIYSLTTPALTWTITHNKGRLVNVVMYDTSGQEIELNISCPDDNSVVLDGDELFSGIAVVV